jgi:hypothetical protein
LKKGWQNIRTLHIKTTMGQSHRIYGWFIFKSNTYISILFSNYQFISNNHLQTQTIFSKEWINEKFQNKLNISIN